MTVKLNDLHIKLIHWFVYLFIYWLVGRLFFFYLFLSCIGTLSANRLKWTDLSCCFSCMFVVVMECTYSIALCRVIEAIMRDSIIQKKGVLNLFETKAWFDWLAYWNFGCGYDRRWLLCAFGFCSIKVICSLFSHSFIPSDHCIFSHIVWVRLTVPQTVKLIVLLVFLFGLSLFRKESEFKRQYTVCCCCCCCYTMKHSLMFTQKVEVKMFSIT